MPGGMLLTACMLEPLLPWWGHASGCTPQLTTPGSAAAAPAHTRSALARADCPLSCSPSQTSAQPAVLRRPQPRAGLLQVGPHDARCWGRRDGADAGATAAGEGAGAASPAGCTPPSGDLRLAGSISSSPWSPLPARQMTSMQAGCRRTWLPAVAAARTRSWPAGRRRRWSGQGGGASGRGVPGDARPAGRAPRPGTQHHEGGEPAQAPTPVFT